MRSSDRPTEPAFDDFNRSEDDVDLPTPGEASRPPVTSRIVAHVLARAMGGPKGHHLWLRSGGSLTVFRVAGETWCEPVRAALTALQFGLDIRIAKPDRRGADTLSPISLAEPVAAGSHVVVVSTLGVSTDLAGLCDRVFTLSRPDVRLVRAVIREVTGQRARGLVDRDLAGLDLPTLVAAIREGSSANDCVARLRRASTARTTPVDRPSVADVQDLVGYGAAGLWARGIVTEVQRLHAGEPITTLESVLFYGPPGTGKTTLAAAIARSARLPLIETSVAQWFATTDGNLGDVIKASCAFFDRVIAAAPAVAFIDELDALPDRAALGARNRDWWTSVVTSTLTQVERLRRHQPPVLLIAATNDRSRVDAALLRAGRFDRHIEILPPGEDDLALILGRGLDGALAESDTRYAARLGRGATGATAVAWIEAAKRRARDAGRAVVTADLLAEVAPSDPRSPKQQREVALHEAGHVVAALTLGKTVEQVSILADANAGGTTWIAADPTLTIERLNDQLTVAMAGRAADAILGEGADAGAVGDLARATRLAAAAHLQLGLRDTLTHHAGDSLTAALRLDKALAAAVEADLRAAYERACMIVTDRRTLVTKVADALLVHRVLVAADLVRLQRAWVAARRRTLMGASKPSV